MRPYLRIFPYLLLYCLISALLYFGGNGFSGDDLKLWPDWYTLVCTEDSAEVEAELGNSVNILSPRTAEVRINGFDGELRVSLADIPQRFSPLDPRLDPFIQALPALFRGTRNGQPAELLYVSRDIGLRELQAQLRAAGFSDNTVIIADLKLPSPVRNLLIFFIALGGVLVFQQRHRLLSFFVLLPWGVGVFVSGPEALFLVLLGVFSIPAIISAVVPVLLQRVHDPDQILDRFSRGETIVLLAGLFLSMAFYGFYVSFVDFLIFPFSAALAGFALIKARLLLEELRTRRMVHTLFIHVPLKRRNSQMRRNSFQAAVVALAMVVSFLLQPGNSAGEISIPLGSPTELSGTDLSRNIARLAEAEKESGLPSLPMYLTHRFFQENYLYNPVFSLPLPGDEVTIPAFSHENNRIFELDRPIWRFTDQWYTAIITDDTDRISNFFIHEGIPKGILLSAVTFGSAPVYGAYPGFGLLLTLMFIGLVRALEGRRRSFSHINGSFESRSISQTA